MTLSEMVDLLDVLVEQSDIMHTGTVTITRHDALQIQEELARLLDLEH